MFARFHSRGVQYGAVWTPVRPNPPGTDRWVRAAVPEGLSGGPLSKKFLDGVSFQTGLNGGPPPRGFWDGGGSFQAAG